MNEFRLFAHGVTFDPDDYLASAPLKFDGVWHKGEAGHNHPKSSGVFKVLGVKNAVAAFASYGSTAPAEVERQIARWKKKLAGEEAGKPETEARR